MENADDIADIAEDRRIAGARAAKMRRWFEDMAAVDDYRRDYFLAHAAAMANMSRFWFARADAAERGDPSCTTAALAAMSPDPNPESQP